MPGAKRGEVHAKLRGELFGILDFVEAEHRHRPGEVRTKVEARPRNQSIKPVAQSDGFLRLGTFRKANLKLPHDRLRSAS